MSISKSSLEKYRSIKAAFKKAGIKAPRHRSPSKGQYDYAVRLYNRLFEYGDVKPVRVNKTDAAILLQTDSKSYKGRVFAPTYGAQKIKVNRDNSGRPNIVREYPNKTSREIKLPNGALISDAIVQAFNELQPGQFVFVRPEGKGVWPTPLQSAEAMVKYANAFSKEYNKNEAEMSQLFSALEIVEYTYGVRQIEVQKLRAGKNVKKKVTKSKGRGRRS